MKRAVALLILLGCVVAVASAAPPGGTKASATPRSGASKARTSPEAASAGSSSSGAGVNVRSLGAIGDGQQDDTQAFLSAVKKCAGSSRQVLVPPGSYVISRPIEVKNVAIVGSVAAAWPSDVDALPSIKPVHLDGPVFRLLDGARLHGLDISYDPKATETTGPAAIAVSGIGTCVSDVRVRYAWDGIAADGFNNVGRANFENIFMVSIRNVGVRLLGTWDVPRLANIEVWNAQASEPGDHALEEGVGFLLGKNDLIRLTDCFAFGMHYGFMLENQIPGCAIEGETWGTMNGCSADFCGYGVYVRGKHTVSISGGSLWTHASGVVVEGDGARVRLTGSEVRSNGAPAVVVRGGDQVVVSGCSLTCPMETTTGPAVLLEGGRTTLGTNDIQSYGTGVQIGPGARSALVQGNTIESHGSPAFIDKHSSSSRVLVDGNLRL